MIGIVDALMKLLLQGQRLRPAQALEAGIVDEVVATREDLIPRREGVDRGAGREDFAGQPWDAKGYKIPGGTPATPKLAMNLPAFPANLRKQIKGANYPAPHHIMAAAVEGAQVDFDNASEIEGRYFVDLVTGQVAKNMIQAFFFDLQRVNGDRGRPEGLEPFAATKVVVLGAGMMGAAIAYVCAKAGIEVVLKDVSLEAAAARQGLLREARRQGRRARQDDAGEGRRAARAHHRDRATPPTRRAPTSSSRRSSRTRASRRRSSPRSSRTWRRTRCWARTRRRCRSRSWPRASRGRRTSSACTSSARWTRCRCWRSSGASRRATRRSTARSTWPSRSRKTPIVVNDSRGFFTSRVIGTFINEGIAMLAEGVPAPTIEQASVAGRLPGAGAAALRRAQPQAHAQDPPGGRGGRRGGAAAAGTRTRADAGHRPDARRVRPSRQARGRAASTSTRTASAPACGRGCARRSRRSRTRRRSSCATSRSGCCSSRRSRRSSASTRA